MDWNKLISRNRVALDGAVEVAAAEPARSVFERDSDRILFCSAFRRMHDKTQVFPLPDADVVHSRLTHSLEVASVGRSLGKAAGRTICQRHKVDDRAFDFHDVGYVVSAACLAHDIGNPPFGHAGEDAIASFFRADVGKSFIASLSERQKFDFENFEGNAQGFRLLTRLQLEVDGGLRLTAATLAAFCKYPRQGGKELKTKGRVETKKHGAFQDDVGILDAVANDTGLLGRKSTSGEKTWVRHPLAFLVEAADDICYSILDIEDAVRLGYVQPQVAQDALGAIASKATQFSQSRLDGFAEARARVGYLRAMAIGQLLKECVGMFLDSEAAILAGDFGDPLADCIPSKDALRELGKLAATYCYRAPAVLQIELAGYEALGGLLETFVEAVFNEHASTNAGTEPSNRTRKTLALLEMSGVRLNEPSLYTRLLRVTDYVSGMTDRYALSTYRRLTGISVPGHPG